MANKHSIQREFLRNMVSIAFISIGLWSIVWIHGEYAAFKSESKSLRAEFIGSQKRMLQSEVAGVVKNIRYMKAQAEAQMRRLLKERVYEAHDIALNIYSQNKDFETPAEIGDMIKDALRSVRFNAGRGYYFAVSMDGVEQLYPVRPEFEGQNLLDLQDSKGNYVIQDEINVIRKSGEGFVTDYWTKPGRNTTKLFPKLSFVKHFKPLDWYFGAGEYLDDAKTQIQHEVLNRIADLRFGTEGYFFGSTFKGDSLFSNGKITVGGVNIWDLTDHNGVKIIQEQRKAVENPEGGFVSYSWHKLDTSQPSPKTSYVLGIPEWKWTIGAGVYLDSIETTIAARKKMLENSIRKKIITSTFVLVALFLLIYLWSKRISDQLANAIKTFTRFLKDADTKAITINPDHLELKELIDIAELTNKMLLARRRTEDELKTSEYKFRSFAEQSLVGIYMVQGSVFKYVNPRFADIFGYTVEECLYDLPFHNLVHPDDRALVTEQVDRRLKKEVDSVHYSFKGIKKSGETIHVEILGSYIDLYGMPAVTGTILDITDKWQQEIIRDRLLIAIEQADETIVITDMDGNILYANPAFERITGYSRKEAVGKNPRILKSGEQDEPFYRQMWQTISQGKVWHGRLINRKKNGMLYTEEASISPVVGRNGKIVNYVAVKRDISNEIAMEEMLQQAQKMETIGTLAGGIAHDFNNILFPIVGHSEMLMEDMSEDDPIRINLNEIYSAAIRARDLVKQILTFSRQDSNEIKLIKIQPVIREALKLIQSTLPTTIRIKQHIRSDPIIVKADPTQLHQVVMNLATNAFHAMENTGGVLKVSLKKIELNGQNRINPEMNPGFYACLIIADTGTGIDDNVRKNIFDPFFTTKKQGKGTGMGLSVVHGIVKKAGGAIQVNSKLGKGTEFHIYLPVEMSFSVPQELQTGKQIQGGTERILLVDDEESVIFMEKQMLERLGYRVVARTSSVEALEAFRADPANFDLVITDMAMPNMSGDQLASELIKTRADIPVILCTGFSEKIPEEMAEYLGIKGFLMKPIVMKDLSEKIREVLDDSNASTQQ